MEPHPDNIDMFLKSNNFDFSTDASALLSLGIDPTLLQLDETCQVEPALQFPYPTFDGIPLQFNFDSDLSSTSLSSSYSQDPFFALGSDFPVDIAAEADSSLCQQIPKSPSSDPTRPYSISNATSCTDISNNAPMSPNPTGGSTRPHYASERRYRASLNAKLSELNKSIPALEDFDPESMVQKGEWESGKTNSSNKAFILEKAIRYIRYLEKHHQEKEQKLRALKQRVRLSLALLNGQTAAFATQKVNLDPMSDTMSLML